MSPKEFYQSNVSLLSQLPVFCQPWWLDAVYEDWDVILAPSMENVQLVYPFQKEKKLTVSLVRPGLLTAYNAPFFLSDNIDEKVIEQLLQHLPNNGFHTFTTYPNQKINTFLKLQDFTQKELVTYRIALQQNVDVLFQNIHPKRRNAIRKAEQDLSVLVEALNAPEFYKWHKHTLESKKEAYPYTLDFFKKLSNAAIAHNSSICITAVDAQGNRYGTNWLVHDGQVMYNLLSATNPALTHRGAISILLWTAIQKAKDLGLSFFDFEGSMDAGIAHFFKRFGGEATPYFIFEKNDSLLWKIKQKILG